MTFFFVQYTMIVASIMSNLKMPKIIQSFRNGILSLYNHVVFTMIEDYDRYHGLKKVFELRILNMKRE